MSKVVSLKKSELKKLGYESLEEWLNASPNHVYIGRDMTHYVKGAVGSKWGNPFKHVHDADVNCRLKMYKEHILSNKDLVNSLDELKGKVLGCWCHPNKCHGDVLVELVNQRENNEN